jgi:methylenetetrahydrofolate dehydrogenase (NADP+)/methenyltetrahydrofolate cyclohydrolase
MSGKVMDGRIVAQKIRAKIRERLTAFSGSDLKPQLVTILVGDNPASKAYVKNKHASCLDVGLASRNIELPRDVTQQALQETIRQINEDRAVTGILLELPLTKGLDDVSALSAIDPAKDVDGLHPYNLGLLLQKRAELVPCTPKGVLSLLGYYGVRIAGRNAVVVNRSKLVGRPLSQLLLNEDATVTVCHSKTEDLQEICSQADILITGIGRRSEFTVESAMIKDGATVIDVGTSSVDGRLMGDVDFDAAIKVAQYVSPVPGGVGPMTIAMLLYNTLLAACLQNDVDMGFDLNGLKGNRTD